MSQDTAPLIATDAEPHPTPDVVPRRCTLDGFVEEVSRTHGVGLADVDAFSTLVVRTRNSVYRITILRPWAREVLVQGGEFFTARTRACLNGSSFGGSCLSSAGSESGRTWSSTPTISGSSRRVCDRSRWSTRHNGNRSSQSGTTRTYASSRSLASQHVPESPHGEKSRHTAYARLNRGG